jgi:glycosyltransferase involved in cell wall biosynthesis
MRPTNKKQNILILHSSSDLYGASKILLVTVDFLKQDGHNIYVVLSDEGPLADNLRALNIEVIIVRLGIIRRKYFSIGGLLNRFKVILNAKKKITQVIKEKQINILYSNTTAVLVGAFVAKATKVKHIWHVHEILTQPIFLVKFIGWILNKYSDRVIVVSDAVKKHWEKYVLTDKTVTIYNGIDYSTFLNTSSDLRQTLNIDDNIILMGMIGRVHHLKGQEYFLHIATLIAKNYKNVRFIMVGDVFPGNEYLYEKIDSIKRIENIEHLVTDLGYRTDIPNILRGLDLFVLPSILPDSFPTVILEAMASGKPIAATNHGGATEMLVNNKTGVLIPWDDAKKAAILIEELLKDDELRKAMGTNGRERVLKEFSMESYGQNFINLINSIN